MIGLEEIITMLRNGRLIGLLDQGLYSLSSMSVLYVYAMHLQDSDFGVFGIYINILFFLISIQRSIIVLPMTISYSQNDQTQMNDWKTTSFALNVLIFAAACVVFVVIFFAGGDPITFILALSVAFGAPASLFFEYARRNFYLLKKHREIAIIASCYFITQQTACIYVTLGHTSLEQAVAAHVLALCISAAIAFSLAGSPFLRFEFRTVWTTIRHNKRRMGWNLASYLPYSIYNNGIVLILGLFFAPTQLAAMIAMRLFLAPITTLISAVDSVDKPRAARAMRDEGLDALYKVIRSTWIILLSISIPYAAFSILGLDEITTFVFSKKFPDADLYVYAWIVVGILMVTCQPQETFLMVSDNSQRYFYNRLFSGLLSLLVLFVSMDYVGVFAGMLAIIAGWFSSAVSTSFHIYRTRAKFRTSAA